MRRIVISYLIIEKNVIFLPILCIVFLVYGKNPKIIINELMVSNGSTYSDEAGEFDDWIELYNDSDQDFDIGGMYLSDDSRNKKKWKIPEYDSEKTTILSRGFLIIWLDTDTDQGLLHASFKLSSDGEEIVLTDSDGIKEVDRIFFDKQILDISYGRYKDGESKWEYFKTPTPGERNRYGAKKKIVQNPIFSLKSGFYNGIVKIGLSTSSSTAKIFFSVDGSEPMENKKFLYTSAIKSDTSIVVRARVFEKGLLPSPVITRTYIINEKFDLPVISITTDPKNLYDWETGIYVKGPHASDEMPYYGANYYKDWEKKAHFEYFDVRGVSRVDMVLGLKISGSWSRWLPKKSFSINAKEKFGSDIISYSFFSDKDFSSFQSLKLRADAVCGWHMKNELIYKINKHLNNTVDIQTYSPAVLFLNGQYWGIYNIMETKGADFIKNNYGLTDVDILEGWGRVIEGNRKDYESILNYMNTNDIEKSSVYQHIKSRIDIMSFMDFWIYEFYTGKHDNTNIRYWHPRTSEGKWRWISYDMDSWNNVDYNLDEITIFEDRAVDQWLLGRMLHNKQFSYDFSNRCADLLNSVLKPEFLTRVIDTIRSDIGSEIEREIKRWGKVIDDDHFFPVNSQDWKTKEKWMNQFFRDRPDIVRNQIVKKLNLDGTASITVNSEFRDVGYIQINTLNNKALPWSGIYFKGIPIIITAVPEIGYIFTGWSDTSYQDNPTITLNLCDDLEITAYFKKSYAAPIVINEISYISSEGLKNCDWIELYNTSEKSIDLSECHIKYGKDESDFVFPAETMIRGNGYLVLCQDIKSFKEQFPDVKNCVVEFPFNLEDEGEIIRFYDKTELLIDSLAYNYVSPWPVIPVNARKTIELISWKLDNACGENWAVSKNHGTPGEHNSTFKQIELINFVFHEKSYPNPFSDRLTIKYNAPLQSKIHVTIYNNSGRVITSLYTVNSSHKPIVWDAQDTNGNTLPSGTYLYRITVTDSKGRLSYVNSRKVFLIK
jgi:hypothetical protein